MPTRKYPELDHVKKKTLHVTVAVCEKSDPEQTLAQSSLFLGRQVLLVSREGGLLLPRENSIMKWAVSVL